MDDAKFIQLEKVFPNPFWCGDIRPRTSVFQYQPCWHFSRHIPFLCPSTNGRWIERIDRKIWVAGVASTWRVSTDNDDNHSLFIIPFIAFVLLFIIYTRNQGWKRQPAERSIGQKRITGWKFINQFQPIFGNKWKHVRTISSTLYPYSFIQRRVYRTVLRTCSLVVYIEINHVVTTHRKKFLGE